MAEFNFDNLAQNLPDCYKKGETSNNYKILEIERRAGVGLRDCLNGIAEILDIEKATGAALNAYGERFGQPRGKATDQQYRIMIKSKIAKTLSNGSYRDIVDVMCFAFGCTIDDVLFVESPTTPMTVSLEQLPLTAVNAAGFATAQAYQLIKSMMPVAIELQSVLFEGTFEFADTENEYDETAGFATSETDQSIGGKLGGAESDVSENPLPI